jgi:hypothetical protein
MNSTGTNHDDARFAKSRSPIMCIERVLPGLANSNFWSPQENQVVPGSRSRHDRRAFAARFGINAETGRGP